MELTMEQMLQGKATRIKDKEYFTTEAYVLPFIERVSKLTDNFIIQAKPADQISLTKEGEINFDDGCYKLSVPFLDINERLSNGEDTLHEAICIVSNKLDMIYGSIDFKNGMSAVKIAAANLKKDFAAVLQADLQIVDEKPTRERKLIYRLEAEKIISSDEAIKYLGFSLRLRNCIGNTSGGWKVGPFQFDWSEFC